MQFQPPNIPGLQKQNTIPQTLDDIFNSYMQMKKFEQDKQAGALSLQNAQYQNIQNRGQFGGYGPEKFTPALQQQAAQNPLVQAPGPAQNGMTPMQSAGAIGGSDEDRRLVGILQSIQARDDWRQNMERRKESLAADLTRSEIARNDRAIPEGGASLESMLAGKVRGGEMTLEDALKMRASASPSMIAATAKAGKVSEKELAAQDAAIENADLVISKVDQALKNTSKWSTGLGAATVGKFPGSQARNLQGDLDTIKAQLGFSTLAEMKRASPSGGALGAISESEMRLLTAARASLDTAQSDEQIRQHLGEIKTHFKNWKNAVIKSRQGGESAGIVGSAGKKSVGRFQIVEE